MKNTVKVVATALLAAGMACEPNDELVRNAGAGGSAKGGRGGALAGGGTNGASAGVAGMTSAVGAFGGAGSSVGLAGNAGFGGANRGGTTTSGLTGGATSTSAGSGGKAGMIGTGGISGAGGPVGGAATGGLGGGAMSPSCTGCHGDPASNNPAPPSDTLGNSDSTAVGVGAHAKHLGASSWHRQSKCTDCHLVPTSTAHANGKVELVWGPPGNAKNAQPAYDATSLTCTGTYCHGTTLPGSASVKTRPVWNQVNETWNECGTACHETPPAASTGHPNALNCEDCHSKVIASFKATSASTMWKDATLHINGTVEVDALTCTSCHGSGNSPAPPKDTNGGTATTAAGVGAHAQHLASSTWHRRGLCSDCHITPVSNTHSNNVVDFAWGLPSNAGNATPAFNAVDLSCSGAYCHGAKMADKSTAVGHVPIWNKVDGTHDACGKACHANPPSSGSHTSSSTACQNCHGDVIASYSGANSTWKNASLHINGKVEATAQSCSSCHGNPPSTSIHNRREHRVACTNCHPNPSGSTHQNGRVDQSCGSNKAGCHDGDD